MNGLKSHASLWALLVQIWRGAAGLVTVWLTSTQLSAEQQGWYYALLTVAGASAVFELGLGSVLINVAAKVREQISPGHPGWPEDSSIGSSFIDASIKCFFAISLAYMLFILPTGLWFFSSKPSVQEGWIFPWIVLCVSTAGHLLAVPFLAIAQTDGKAAGVFRMQLLQAVLGSLICWYLLRNDGQLWACAAMPVASCLIAWPWLMFTHSRLLRVRRPSKPPHFSWQARVWPLQWRAAVTTVCSYVSTQLFVPIIFAMHGAAAAAKFALGLALVNMIGVIGLSLILAESSTMAALAARREWTTLDRIFGRRFFLSMMICLLVSVGLMGLAANHFQVGSDILVAPGRLPTLTVLSLLLGWAIANLLIAGLGVHLRAHQVEPFAAITVMSTAIQIPLIFVLTFLNSDYGTSLALCITSVLISLPMAYLAWRKEIGKIRGVFQK